MRGPVAPSEARVQAILEQKQAKQRYIPHKPHAKQMRFLELDCLEALYGGAAGSGKSDALLVAALKYVHVPRYAAILFRRTFTDLALPGAIMDRSHEWLTGTDARWEDRTKTWHFPSAATLTFGYMDGPNDRFRYASAEFQFVGFDELTQFTERDYLFLFSRLRRANDVNAPLRFRSATNPGGIGHEWVGLRFGIPAEPDNARTYEHEGRVFLPARASDNPSINLAEYVRSLGQLDSVTRQQLLEGHWVRDTSGLVYSDFGAKNHAPALPDLEKREEWQYVLGIDFGVVDATAFCALAYTVHEPNVYVVESRAWVGMSPSEAAEECMRWRERYPFEAMVGDIGGLGKAYEAEWKTRFHLPLEPADKAGKLGFMKLLNGDFREGKTQLLPGNEELSQCLTALAWADEKCLKEHDACDNHLTDALLYAWRRCRHYQATERVQEPKYGTPEYWEKEARDRYEAVRERVERQAGAYWWEAEQ